MFRKKDPKGKALSLHVQTHVQCIYTCSVIVYILVLCTCVRRVYACFKCVVGSVYTEMMRQQQRELKKTNRELERDRGGLDRQERQLVSRR